VNILAYSGDKVLTVQGSFEKGEYRWQLSSSHPMLSCHVMPVDFKSTENWPALRARHLIAFLGFFAILLLAIGVLRQLRQLIGELMTIDLLDRVEQDDWSLLDCFEPLRVRRIILVDDISERHDGLESSLNVPQKITSYGAVKLSRLATDAFSEFFRRHLL